MKKIITTITFSLLFIISSILYSSCNKSNEVILKTETWKEAYAEFLIDLFEIAYNDVFEFSLRDLDNNGVPELLVIQKCVGMTENVLTIYSYNDKFYKIGGHFYIKNSSELRFSDNPMFLGLFDYNWGGGLQHYKYVTVHDEMLINEYLWQDDNTTEPPQRIIISDNKQLIDEASDIYKDFDNYDNILEMHLVNHDNITKILKQ